MMTIIAAAMLATPAHAGSARQQAVGDTQSEGCAKAREAARERFGERIRGFNGCQCEKRSNNAYSYYVCTLTVPSRD